MIISANLIFQWLRKLSAKLETGGAGRWSCYKATPLHCRSTAARHMFRPSGEDLCRSIVVGEEWHAPPKEREGDPNADRPRMRVRPPT